ncbi:hypothetical protein EYF80_005735 [Liparis tanakae]|uniref:Uncharacterized protein n=1 Tax=Liparis tanakae TaxID=230148 RepID=A0A4Z2J201_9TELE|nr:hypothetical protein EYF80_005735 [Liparis tanakae]
MASARSPVKSLNSWNTLGYMAADITSSGVMSSPCAARRPSSRAVKSMGGREAPGRPSIRVSDFSTWDRRGGGKEIEVRMLEESKQARLHVRHVLRAFFSETVEEEDEWKDGKKKGRTGKGCCGTNDMKLYLPTRRRLSDNLWRHRLSRGHGGVKTNSTTDRGKDSSSARSSTSALVRLFCTMN